MSLKVTFTLFGVGVLLPWQCLLSSMEFMDLDAFPGSSWALLLSPVFNAVAVSTQAIMLFLGEYFTAWKLACFALPPAVCLVIVPLVCLFPEVGEAEERGRTALAGCAGIAFFVAGLFQSASCQLAVRLAAVHGPMPAHFSNGLAVSGVMAAAVSSAVTAVAGQRAAVASLLALCAAVLAVSLLALLRGVRDGTFCDDGEEPLSGQVSPLARAAYALGIRSPTFRGASPAMSPSSSCGSLQGGSYSASPTNAMRRSSSQVFTAVSAGVASAWPKLAAMFILYVQTYLAFPAVCMKWAAPHGWVTQETYGLLIVSAFQVCDLIGRLLCTKPKLRALRVKLAYKVGISIFLRSALPALFFLCWRMPDNPVLGTAAAQLAIVGLHGFSQGVLTNYIFAWSSAGVAESCRDVIGRAVPLCLCTGIVVGSALSSLLVARLSS